jgi:hypothetical protein
MAQTDAMETAKEILRQIIKYRFWISISVAALFAVIAYSVGSGPIREAAAKETSAINAAEKEVQGYTGNNIPTKEYKPIVEEKTQVLTQDVNAAWRTLYERQAPLLTWPGETQQRFQTWGRQWPEKVDPKKIELAEVDYIEAYPAYVAMVYKTFNPFNYETGEGVVASPSEGELLSPAHFDQAHLPDLGKIWAAQERLWIQRTVLEVIAEVNKNAKKWDEAIIRQIVSLDVGSPDSQDQRSLAKAETLEESQGIYAPGEEPAADGTGGSADAASLGGGGKAGFMSGMGGMGRRGGGEMSGMGGSMGGSMGAGQAPGSVFYVKSDSDKYKILPLAVTVLIDQDRVQDFLVELENSPMWIQVKDFELVRSPIRVARPEKGEAGSSLGGMAGMMGGMGRMGSMGGIVGMGGMMQQMQQSMMARQGGAMSGMMGGGYGGMGQVEKKKSGKNVRDIDRGKEREKVEKAVEETRGPSLFDPFFNIVQVKVYGQARFFNAPPADEAPPASASDVAAASAATPADPAAKKADALAQPATAKPAEKAGEAKATEAESAEPNEKDKDAGAAAKPSTPNAKSNSEKSAGSESGGASAKPANGAAAAAKSGPADGKSPEPKP